MIYCGFQASQAFISDPEIVDRFCEKGIPFQGLLKLCHRGFRLTGIYQGHA